MANKKYTVTFKVICDEELIANEPEFFVGLHFGIEDLLNSSILPALNVQMEKYSLELKRARK